MFGLFSAQNEQKEGHLFSEPSMAETYRDILRDHSLRRINRIIENDTFVDSSSVYERFFLDCKAEIRVVARGIKKEIFDRPNVIAAAERFLGKDSARLVLDIRAKNSEDAYNTSTTEFFRAISDSASGSDRLQVKFYHEVESDTFLGDLPSVSFGDGRMYRKRSYQKEGDYTTHANADVNFNDKDTVLMLTELIDKALGKEKVLDF